MSVDCIKEDELAELRAKAAKLEQRDEFNDRWMGNFTKMIDKIDRNIEKLTIAVQQIAVQQEQINALRKGRQDDRDLIEKLFSGQRRIADDITDMNLASCSVRKDSQLSSLGRTGQIMLMTNTKRIFHIIPIRLSIMYLSFGCSNRSLR